MPFNSETGKEARAKAKGRGESKLKKLFREYADANDVKELFDVLKEKALVEKDLDAIKTLLAYVIGKPSESLDLTSAGESLKYEVTLKL